MPIEVRLTSRRSTRRFHQTQLVISGCLTLIIGIFTIVYTIQQNTIANAYRKQSLISAQVLHEQKVYDSFIEDISKLILAIPDKRRKINDNWDQWKQSIRVKLLSALPQMNLNQRKNVLYFLYDNDLIRSDGTSDSINLSEADFSGIQFRDETCYLANLSLRNVYANHIEFNGCNLMYADFTGARMIGAKFISTRIGSAKLDQTNLTGASFQSSNTAGIRFYNAILVRSRFTNAPQNMKFINTDLYENNWSKEQIVNNTFNQQSNTVVNTRFPDGSFSQINSTQLLVDNGAELGCGQKIGATLYNEPRPQWRQDYRYSIVSLINSTYNELYTKPVEGDCYFQCHLNKSELEQAINVKDYSLMISNARVKYHLSAFFCCPFQHGRPYVEIGFYTAELTSAGLERPKKMYFNETIYNATKFYRVFDEGDVPVFTRMIYIGVGADKLDEHTSDYCFVDDIRLHLLRKE